MVEQPLTQHIILKLNTVTINYKIYTLMYYVVLNLKTLDMCGMGLIKILTKILCNGY